MSIRIITDSSCDMEPEEFLEKQITCIPLPVSFGETTYETIDKMVFFEKLTSEATFPHTSQPSPQAFLDLFEEAKQAQDDVIVILLSSGLSGTYQTACMAKDMVEYDRIFLIDSLSATVSLKLLADHAVTMRDTGASAEEIAASLDSLRKRTKILAVMDTLEYLYKGGRLTKAQAGLGNLARLKPLITIGEDGQVHVIGKGIGKKRANASLLKEFSRHLPDPSFDLIPLFSFHDNNCLEMLEELKQAYPEYSFQKPMNIGAAIGSHIGPDACGIVYIMKE